MKTIGQFLKQAREEKNFSLTYLERKTKIKKSFIEAIEEEDWKNLPEFPVIMGFAKNIASALNKDVSQVTAFLKRDYPPSKVDTGPKQDVGKKFSWTPKVTFFLGITTVVVLVIGYLAIQYISFISPPKLSVQEPEQNQIVREGTITISGRTDPEATLVVNSQPVIVSSGGEFRTQIEVSEETREVVFTATSRSGKVSSLSRSISVEK